MYQSIFYDYPSKTYYLKDDQEEGWSYFKYHPELYRIHPKGNLPTIDGKLAFATKKYEWNDDSLYEKDVDKLTRVLIDQYSESDEPPKSHNIVYFDIECEIGGTLTPDYIKSAPMKITSFALYDVNSETYYCLILDEDKQLTKIIEDKKKIIPYTNEKELLSGFLSLWEKLDATIIIGYNSGFFDVPYLYYRLCNILGKSEAERLSPIRKFKFTDWDVAQPIEIGGISHLDYMLLFKRFIVKQEPSYKLNDIGEKYVKLGKVEYEGSLDKLFKSDITTFIDYNIRDVEILVKLDKKFQFIDLTINICHLCHVPYEQIYLSTALNDGAILTYLRRKGIVSTNKPTTINPALKESNDEDYAGGYLKDPVPGLYEWVIDLDYTSLYPSIIRSLNIGIETLIGRIVNNGKYDNQWTLNELLDKKNPSELITIEKLNEDKTTSRAQIEVGKLIKLIITNKWVIAASGCIFRTDNSSVVCEVLTDWFNKRKQYKELMSKAYKSGNKELGEHYHRLQHAYKIKLNDVYGCYAINGWRYTDGHKMISGAITLTGQRLLQESIVHMNGYMNNILKTDKDIIITGDTDSIFIHVKDLLIHRYPDLDLNDKNKVIPLILEIATELQKEANKFIGDFAMKSFNIPKDRGHFFELKQEVVIERGYFAAKRRYAMHIVNKEGVDTEEMIMMGLDLMKSNMPPLYKKFGIELLEDIMFGKPKPIIDSKIVDFKISLDTMDWKVLARPTGVKQIRSYIAKKPAPGEIFSELRIKCPPNTRAAIATNDLIKFKGLEKKYSYFVEGDKMRYVSLKENPFKLSVLGFRGEDDPEFIIDFIDKYVDREATFNSILLNKLQNIYSDIGYEFPILNSKINKFFSWN